MIVSTEGVREKMPAAHPEEFRRRAVQLARLQEKPIAQIAKDLGISESCLRRWMGQADVEDGHKEGLINYESEGLTADEVSALVLKRRTDCWGLSALLADAFWPVASEIEFGKVLAVSHWVGAIHRVATNHGIGSR